MSNPVPTQEVQDGDDVKVQFKVDDEFFTIEGKARLTGGDLCVAGWVIAHGNGNPGPHTFCVIERLAVEPPLGTVVQDSDGDYWAHLPDGWCLIGTRNREAPYSWKRLNDSWTTEVVTA